MSLLLAPMEGVVDWVMRDLLTRIGGFSHAATEFIRITHQKLPPSVFYRYAPELKFDGRTRSGVPVYIQLLGGNPEWMAVNAQQAVSLGALGIDLNFGCPAKTVNRHDGGAVLLKTPERIHKIVAAVRRAVPKKVPVTVKIRLGYDSPDRAIEIAQAAETAGATWLTVHARTRQEAYRPPAHWDWLGRIREAVQLKVIANGDIWSHEDYIQCRRVSGCDDFMLGRGVIARPDLAFQICYGKEKAWCWEQVKPWVLVFFQGSRRFRSDHYAVCRIKQWLRLLGRNYEPAIQIFEGIKREREFGQIWRLLCEAVGEAMPHLRSVTAASAPGASAAVSRLVSVSGS